MDKEIDTLDKRIFKLWSKSKEMANLVNSIDDLAGEVIEKQNKINWTLDDIDDHFETFGDDLERILEHNAQLNSIHDQESKKVTYDVDPLSLDPTFDQNLSQFVDIDLDYPMNQKKKIILPIFHKIYFRNYMIKLRQNDEFVNPSELEDVKSLVRSSFRKSANSISEEQKEEQKAEELLQKREMFALRDVNHGNGREEQKVVRKTHKEAIDFTLNLPQTEKSVSDSEDDIGGIGGPGTGGGGQGGGNGVKKGGGGLRKKKVRVLGVKANVRKNQLDVFGRLSIHSDGSDLNEMKLIEDNYKKKDKQARAGSVTIKVNGGQSKAPMPVHRNSYITTKLGLAADLLRRTKDGQGFAKFNKDKKMKKNEDNRVFRTTGNSLGHASETGTVVTAKPNSKKNLADDLIEQMRRMIMDDGMIRDKARYRKEEKKQKRSPKLYKKSKKKGKGTSKNWDFGAGQQDAAVGIEDSDIDRFIEKKASTGIGDDQKLMKRRKKNMEVGKMIMDQFESQRAVDSRRKQALSRG